MRKLLSFLIVWMMLPCIALGDALQVDMPCLHPEDEAAFLAGHPGLSLEYGQHGLFNTGNELNAALLTGTMAYDIFTQRNVYMDYRQTMARGYCLDLSGSEVIRQAVARMVPAVAQQVMMDGRVYGLPTGVQFDLLYADEAVFEQLGYDATDVPKTCEEFLSFLEAWVTRQDADPEAVQVFGDWDYTVYDATAYTVELARLLLEEAIRQQQAAGETLSFSDPMLLDALTRVRQIGQALARVEPPSASVSAGEWRTNQPALFVRYDPNPWGRMADWGISLRMHPEQPFTLPVMLQVTMVSAATTQPEVALAYMEAIAAGKLYRVEDAAFLYQDVACVVNDAYGEQLAYAAQMVAMLEGIAAEPAAPINTLVEDSMLSSTYHENFVYWYAAAHQEEQQDAVERMLARYRAQLANAEAERYIVSPAQVADYRQCAEYLSFPVPSAFTPGSVHAQTFNSLLERFAAGQMDAAQLLRELDRLAQMAALEAL
ncbi:MAG: extracellular solute-binding protein [Aristaeellaceae bacterium]